ncbi:MAG: ABC transporter substrate-binding protein [Oscillospiraceae bacterium]|nr:ABC transporter substrate-binding protein [Oscillospiraceae bacterium]
MKKKKILALLLATAMIFVFVAACAQTEDPGTADPTPAPATPPPADPTPPPELVTIVDDDEGEGVMIHPALLELLDEFPFATLTSDDVTILNRGDAGNILRVACVGSSTFIGLLLPTHSSESFDASLAGIQDGSLVSIGPGNRITSNGVATYEIDRAANTVTMNMQESPVWHDGTPLTLDDLVFAFELIGHPDYTGTRYGTSQVHNIVGIEEYREGEADNIAGLQLSNNNRTLVIQFIEPFDMSFLFAGGLWTAPVARHWITPVLEDPDFGHAGLDNHIRARDEILGWGPFKIDTVVVGESYFFTAFDDFFGGAPNVDGVLVEMVHPELIFEALRAGQYDIAQFTPGDVAMFRLNPPTNFQLLGWPASSYNVFNFRMGNQLEDDEGNLYFEPLPDDHPIRNLAIRRAIAYATDRETHVEVFLNGLGLPAPMILHPFNASPFIDMSFEGFSFDLDRANQVLDEAGFTERDDEGFRLDLNGEPMTLIYGAHDNAANQVWVPMNLQNWNSIGLRVELYGGDFMDWGLFLDYVAWGTTPHPIDIFAMGWSSGMNPDPSSLWGSREEAGDFNMPRYESPTFRRILDDIKSDRSWDDEEFVMDTYRRWAQAFYDEMPAFLYQWSIDLIAANNRVVNVSRLRMDSGDPEGLGNWSQVTWANHLIALTAPEPYVDGR